MRQCEERRTCFRGEVPVGMQGWESPTGYRKGVCVGMPSQSCGPTGYGKGGCVGMPRAGGVKSEGKGEGPCRDAGGLGKPDRLWEGGAVSGCRRTCALPEGMTS